MKEQELPDGNFPTCPYPNPEIREALQKGLDLCETEKPDLLLATDPDCDRCGHCSARMRAAIVLLTGNEVGVLLTDYIASSPHRAGHHAGASHCGQDHCDTCMIDRLATAYGFEVDERPHRI